MDLSMFNGWFPPPGVPLYFWWDLVAVAPLILSLLIGFFIWLCTRKSEKLAGRIVFLFMIFFDSIFSLAASIAAVLFFQFMPGFGIQLLPTSGITLALMIQYEMPLLIAIAAFAIIKAIFIPIFLYEKFANNGASMYKFSLILLWVCNVVVSLAMIGACIYCFVELTGEVGLHFWNLSAILAVLSLIDVIIMSFAVFKKHDSVDDTFNDDVGAW